MTEKEKCRAGMLYNPNYAPELQHEMMQTADLCFRYGLNYMGMATTAARTKELAQRL